MTLRTLRLVNPLLLEVSPLRHSSHFAYGQGGANILSFGRLKCRNFCDSWIAPDGGLRRDFRTELPDRRLPANDPNGKAAVVSLAVPCENAGTPIVRFRSFPRQPIPDKWLMIGRLELSAGRSILPV